MPTEKMLHFKPPLHPHSSRPGAGIYFPLSYGLLPYSATIRMTVFRTALIQAAPIAREETYWVFESAPHMLGGDGFEDHKFLQWGGSGSLKMGCILSPKFACLMALHLPSSRIEGCWEAFGPPSAMLRLPAVTTVFLFHDNWAILSSSRITGVTFKVDVALIKANCCLSVVPAWALLPLSSLSFVAVSVSKLATALVLLSLTFAAVDPRFQIWSEIPLWMKNLVG